MLKTLAIIGTVVVVAIAAILIYAATKPDSFRVQRSAAMSAAPDKIFPYIAGLKRWREWSPYEERDPSMKRTYEGPESGKGAIYAWDGNKNVGSGRMEILEATPARTVIKLDFFKPFEGHNTAEITMEPRGNQTFVTWAMHGPSPYMSKLMSTFMDFDDMIGRDFAAGLAKLKAIVEK
jgi:hypothetical protein